MEIGGTGIMNDPVVARLIEDVAFLKTQTNQNAQLFDKRLEALEDAQRQQMIDKEQASRMEMHNLRMELEEAKKKLGV